MQQNMQPPLRCLAADVTVLDSLSRLNERINVLEQRTQHLEARAASSYALASCFATCVALLIMFHSP